MTATEKVSFTIRRPTPSSRAPSSGAESDANSSYKVPSLPRHLANPIDSTPGSPLARSTTSSPKPSANTRYHNEEPDSSEGEDDAEIRDELITGFDKFGVQRPNKERRKRATPLVIPALKNRDWRDLARKRRSAAQYVPASAKVETGKDGSVGGLGLKDAINTGPVLSGLQLKQRPSQLKQEDSNSEAPVQDVKMEEEEDEDKQALRAILSGTDGAENDGPIIDIIPRPISEADAYKQDVDELPEAATFEDYARVPVSQFGAALLRGMGWKEGTAATRQSGKGMVEPYLPEARPALLGIGAKEREVLDDGSQKNGKTNKRPERRYVPLVKVDVQSSSLNGRDRRERSQSPKSRHISSTTTSRRSSKSRDRGDSHDKRRYGSEYRREEHARDRRRDNSDRERKRDRSRESSQRRHDR